MDEFWMALTYHTPGDDNKAHDYMQRYQTKK